MKRLRDERGITLVEVLVASMVSLIILGATMSIVIVMARAARSNDRQQEAQQTARQTLDGLARELRNMASPTTLLGTADVVTAPRAIERDLPADLIFKDVDQVQPAGSLNKPNVRRVRYCLKSTTPSNGVIYMQTQTWTTAAPPAMPAATACPGVGWTTTRIVTEHVTNAVGNRALFGYSGNAGAVTGTDDASRADIARVTATLYVDADVTQRPLETQLISSVFLRNQNREPIASTVGSQVLNQTTRTIQLNGSASQDPEGQTLTYLWFMDGGPDPIGQGVVFQYKVPNDGIVHTFQLKVRDPANLEGSANYVPFGS
jgi:type II secretory pathway pseudopilin PulG